MGMVGGGRGAFIGGVHRRAAGLDGQIELVAGAFSSDPKKSALSGKDFFIDPSRVYASYKEMAKKEASLPLGRESILFRLWCVIICTSKWLRPFLRQESM